MSIGPHIKQSGLPKWIVARHALSGLRIRLIRMHAVRAWWCGEAEATQPPGLVGLALSGGGIRSATFSLGLIQTLAQRDKLQKIDILSTVSGGSYIGCFLRSLYLPSRYRGIEKYVPGEKGFLPPRMGGLLRQYEFAQRVLKGSASDRDIAGPRNVVRNPLSWLREHSRYLAPNGPSDYGYAFAYLSRNWLAMLYTFALAAALIGSTVALGEREVFHALHENPILALESCPADLPQATNPKAAALPLRSERGAMPADPATPDGPTGDQCRIYSYLSPLLLLALIPAGGAVALGYGYWLTAQMSPNERKGSHQLLEFAKLFAITISFGLIMTLGCDSIMGKFQIGSMLAATVLNNVSLPLLHLCEVLLAVLSTGMLLGLGILVVTLAVILVTPQPLALLTAELRRRLTDAVSTMNNLLLLLVGLGAIETLAAILGQKLSNAAHGWSFATLYAVLTSLLTFIVKKLPDWRGDGKMSGLLSRFFPVIALFAGALLYGAVAVTVEIFVQKGAWDGASFAVDSVSLTGYALTFCLLMLALAAGRADGFINLSSLHSLYASRLTRAYLGATNIERLRSLASKKIADATIIDNHDADYIQPDIYGRVILPAPLHIINTTLNCTIDPKSQIVARDRKGEPLCLDPGGVLVGAGNDVQRLGWSALADRSKAEPLSLGQWCAISGAAASSGMGRLTHLGYALAMTFANVRLGYWWFVPTARPALGKQRLGPQIRRFPARVAALIFPTFVYLANEMTARYSRTYSRQYLSDGGHFENSGAYALIRRDIPLIIVSDNGEDPDFAFADLENLVRKVRIDLGREMQFLSDSDLTTLASTFAGDRSILLDPTSDLDWRTKMRDASHCSILALKVSPKPGSTQKDSIVLWLKPQLWIDLPADLQGYAESHPTFPHESTGDQFFDEAQWESYRKLGEVFLSRILEKLPAMI